MSETKLKRKPDNGNVTKFITDTFKKRECNRFRTDTNQQKTDTICECGYSKKFHCDEALQNESNQSEPLTKTLATDAFGKLEDDEEYIDWKTKLKNIRYVRLDCDTDASNILELFRDIDTWNMAEPKVIFSVLSDSDFDNDAGKEHKMIEIQQIRKMICKSFVEAATLTNAWIITGGLNKGVNQLIGNEVKHRLANWEQIPRAVLGICQWGCLANKKDLLNDSSESNRSASDSNPTGLFLNPHHTHFLLVDDGTQKRSGCESILREKVELAPIKWKTNDGESLSDREYDVTQPLVQDSSHPKVIPLIYILIGGSVNEFRFVERALAKGNPVIIAAGTGGAADIITGEVTAKDGLTLEYLPDIFEKLFHRLDELLSARGTLKKNVRQVIANITGKTKFEPLVEIVELLDKTRVSEGGDQQFRNDIRSMHKIETNELLAGIKVLLMIKQTPSDDSYHSSVNSEIDTVDRMRDVIEQMLVVNEVRPENAKQVVDDLEQNVLNDALTKIRLFYNTDLKGIRKNVQLIRFNIKGRQMETIIVEALKKVNWTNQSDLYMRVADWDNENFFKQLLLKNWTRHRYRNVFKELLHDRKSKVYLCKYVKLMIEHIGNCNWLTEPGGPLEKDFKQNKLCAILLEKLRGLGNRTDTDDERLRIKTKLLFIWCVVNHMAETAMLFWEQGQDCLAMALVAYSESRKQKDLVDMVRYEELKQQQQFFAQLALDFVSKCVTDDSEKTYLLLLSKVKDLADRNPFKIAEDAKFKAFFFADATQDPLSKSWTNRIEKNYSKYKYIPMILSVICPLLAPVFFEINLCDLKILLQDDKQDDKQSCKISQRCKGVGSYFRKVKTFVNTAFVTFYYSFISYIAYMTLFSVVMLTDFRAKISPSEITLTIWTFILIIEEVIQVFRVGKNEYWSNGWNYFDIGTLTLYIIGFFLRIVCYADPTICPACLYVARIILAFSLLICFFRTLQFLSIYEILGPKIHMLSRLVADLVGFLLILAVFVSAYGVVSNVILYPNQPLCATLLLDVFYDAWWSVIQQFDMDALGSNCNKNNVSATITAEYCSSMSDDNVDYVSCKENQCPANNWIVSVLLAFYALLTCIMLLNVLIAMFNSTFSAIEKKEKEVSRMQRFGLIMEYRFHSMIPPPLCVITYPCRIVMHLYNLCKFLRELSTHNNNRTTESDVEGGHNGKKSKPSKYYHETRLLSFVKDWERCMAAKYCKENKEKKGWPVPRIESETSDNFDEIPWVRYIVEQIANQMKDLSSEEIETRIGKETMAFQNRLMQLMRERKEKD